MEILDHQTRNEIRLNSLLKLSQMNEKTYQEVMDFGLQEAIMLTDSKIGYIYHYDESSELFTLYSWSKSAIEQCKVMEQQTSYELQKTGLWGEAVRQRKPIVTNDYNAPNRYKKGYPYGHVHVTSHLNLPIFRHDKIVAVIGVGNKETGYTEDDVKQLQLFMDSLWSITERKRIEQELQESEQKFRTLADFTYDWVYWMSPDLDITYSSPSCERISGYTPEEFINDSNLISSIVHPDDLELYRSHVTMTYHPDSRGNLEEIEFRIITKKGEEKWIAHACRAVFGKEGKFMGRRVSNRDITDKKHSELMLVQSSQDINMLNDNILQMLRVMSHDIRSPLISMAATLKLLQKGRYGNIDASASNTVMDLLIRVHQLLGIADDCLGKASAVDSLMKMEITAIDLRQEVIDVVLDELSNEIEEKKITIDNRLGAIPAGTIIVNASKIWLKVVYRNLFKNAIKYGGNGCTIAFGYEDHGEYYRLNVYNTGATIPEDRRDSLFTKFGRIRQEGEEIKEGMGMGLYLTREIISQHGGEIWYESKRHGNDFVFTLPKG